MNRFEPTPAARPPQEPLHREGLAQAGSSPRRRWPWLAKGAAWLPSLVLALAFLVASWPKLRDPAAFAQAVYRYHVLPDGLVNLTAILVPWLELVAAAFVLGVANARRAGATVLGFLLVVFTVALLTAMLRGIDVSCGCFSVDAAGARIGWWSIGRNMGLLALAYMSWRTGCPGRHRRL